MNDFPPPQDAGDGRTGGDGSSQLPPPSPDDAAGEPTAPLWTSQPAAPEQPGQQGQQGQQPFAGMPGPSGPPPAGPPHTLPMYGPAPQRKPRRAGFAAAVVAASLILGGGAGAAGAAIYTSNHNDNTTPTVSSSTSGEPSRIVNPTAPAGTVERVAAQVLPSVVKIEVQGGTEGGSGSGIILSSDGEILTNNHVVSIAGNGGQIRVDFNDGTSASAKILGTDPLTDTAVIQAQNVSNLKPATIGKSNDLVVGQNVVAIGSPFGLDSTVTSGIVSALNRPVNVGSDAQGNATVYPAIQTDAAINPGNSGGPLVNMAGQVVGINSSIRTASATQGEAGSIGLGFAIPIDEVMPIVEQMTKGETPTHARLGITVGNSGQGQNDLFTGNGAKVESVNNGSAGQKAGLQPGDVITKVDNHLITDSDSLVATIRSYRPGDRVTLTWTHNGQTKTATVTLDSDGGVSKS